MALSARLTTLLKLISKTTQKGEAIHELAAAVNSGGGTAPTADTLSGATAVGKAVMKATDQAAGRTAIGAVDGAGAVAAMKAKTAINALAAVSTANATDEATAIALANANKTAINAVIAALKA